jgi:hypothetical protein
MAIAFALLVSADAPAIHLFSQGLHELWLSPDICSDVPAAIRLLNQRKFDAVIIDLQLKEQSEVLLDEIGLSSANRTAVRFGISDNDPDMTTAFRKRSQFIFERPLSTQSIRNTLKPAYGMILRERRRYFRCPVSVPVTVLREGMQGMLCNSVNISVGGMALSTFVPLVSNESVRVQFTLPDHKVPFSAEATICWSKTGELGVRFVSISDEHKSELQVWLSRKLEETLPELVANQFARQNPQRSPKTNRPTKMKLGDDSDATQQPASL